MATRLDAFSGANTAAAEALAGLTALPQGADDNPAALRASGWVIRRKSVTILRAVSEPATLRRAIPARTAGAPGFIGFGNPLPGHRAPETGGQAAGD